MSSESTSPPHSPQKKALEEKNAVAHSTDSHSPAASTIGPKRARRISLDTFFQPMKPKRAKEEENENCTPDSNAVTDASVERETAVVEDTKPKKVEEGCDASACEAQETATASADS
uniref:Uncharacterized protein n=1 Tax=Plectus sambesii TaxID=2011161 RepID=A0A914VQ58_9BILA